MSFSRTDQTLSPFFIAPSNLIHTRCNKLLSFFDIIAKLITETQNSRPPARVLSIFSFYVSAYIQCTVFLKKGFYERKTLDDHFRGQYDA